MDKLDMGRDMLGNIKAGYFHQMAGESLTEWSKGGLGLARAKGCSFVVAT